MDVYCLCEARLVSLITNSRAPSPYAKCTSYLGKLICHPYGMEDAKYQYEYE